MKNVLVTGIGGNVGQGIIRNIRTCGYPIRIIGCNAIKFSAGNHLCDAFYTVSYSYSESYISEILKIIETESIDLIIPSTDYETYYLAKNIEILNTRIAVSSFEATETYLDKYYSFLFHQKNEIPFANTFLPSKFNSEFSNIIVKPRKGSGSRNTFINPSNVKSFSDDEYIVQELLSGTEITSAFYIDKTNQLHGHITMRRSLTNGMTSEAIVDKSYDYVLEKIITKIKNNITIKGAANIQSMVTVDGDIIPFEINCRISGTNSIRSNFGFKDVKYTLQEYLFNEAPEKVTIINGIAVRMYSDIIYPDTTNIDDCLTGASNHYIF
jgi:carbamoyl-phosphate synthase large subunit